MKWEFIENLNAKITEEGKVDVKTITKSTGLECGLLFFRGVL